MALLDYVPCLEALTSWAVNIKRKMKNTFYLVFTIGQSSFYPSYVLIV
jgi:hypothetical protein